MGLFTAKLVQQIKRCPDHTLYDSPPACMHQPHKTLRGKHQRCTIGRLNRQPRIDTVRHTSVRGRSALCSRLIHENNIRAMDLLEPGPWTSSQTGTRPSQFIWVAMNGEIAVKTLRAAYTYNVIGTGGKRALNHAPDPLPQKGWNIELVAEVEVIVSEGGEDIRNRNVAGRL